MIIIQWLTIYSIAATHVYYIYKNINCLNYSLIEFITTASQFKHFHVFPLKEQACKNVYAECEGTNSTKHRKVYMHIQHK